jgi:hypothetical protein
MAPKIQVVILNAISYKPIHYLKGGSFMKLSNLQKYGGISLILGSLCLTAYSVFFFTLLPFSKVRLDMTPGILNPNWTWICMVAFVGVILMIFGFTAAYSKLYKKSGALGFLGYVFVEIAYLFQACKVTWELCLYPVIAGNQSSIFLFKDSILKNSSGFVVFKSVASISILLGIVLFCLMLVRSKEFPKSAGILIFIGALFYGLGPMLTVAMAISGIIVLSIGCFQVGLKLINQTENA